MTGVNSSKLLLVEDDTRVAQTIIEEFSVSDYPVDWIRSGEDAAAALSAQHAWALVMLELSLPGLDGMSLLRAMRKRADPTPVIIVSRRNSVQARIDSLNAGADDFLGKPFDRTELRARVFALLR